MKSATASTTASTASRSSVSRRRYTLRLCLAAMGVALLAVCSWISVPFFTVPFTMQTFAVFFVIGLLGTRWGFVAILAYIGLGALGVPVFSGFIGGVGKLIGVTGGYIVGFLLSALVTGPLYRKVEDKPILAFAAMLAGLAICYALGTVWFMFVAGTFSWHGLGAALMSCVVPFVPFDICKLLLALFLLRRLKPVLTKSLG